MAIEINDLAHSHAKPAGEGNQPRVQPGQPGPTQLETGPSSTSDTVSVSDTAQRLRSLEASIAQLPTVDTQRVEDIRAAIANGSFEIDPARVAEKMMSFENLL